MVVRWITSERREEWNSFVARERSFGLLQSWEWGEFKEKLGWKAFRITVEEEEQIVAGAQVLIKSFGMGLGSVVYIPRGPIGNWLDSEIAAKLLSELHRVARRHRAIFLKMEPPLLFNPRTCQILETHQFERSPYTNQPRATIQIDLTRDLDDILKEMRKKTRQYIGGAGRSGIIVKIGAREDLPAFYDLMRMTARREGFAARTCAYHEHEWEAFATSKQVVLLMAIYQGQLLAVRTVYYFGKNAAEFHAGSISKFTNLHPNYLLAWEAIKWAKERKCCTYDLWGIPEEIGQAVSEGKDAPVSDRTDGLWGVYRFKSGFSKKILFYIGAYDYIYRPFLYGLIRNKVFNAERIERIAIWIERLKTK